MTGKRNLRLTAQQKQLIKGLNSGLTIADAGRQAGYTTLQASHKAFKSLKLRSHIAFEPSTLLSIENERIARK